MPDTPTALEVAKQWFDQVWLQRDATAIHRLMTADVKGHMEPDIAVNGPDSFLSVFNAFTSSFPDFELKVEDITGDDQQACVRWRVSGTHSGSDMGLAATGRQVSFRGITWLTVKEGKIVEGWDSWNQGALISSLM